MYLDVDQGRAAPTDDSSQNNKDVWWSQRIVRSDVWVELGSTPVTSSSATLDTQKLMALVSRCWHDTVVPPSTPLATEEHLVHASSQISDAYDALVARSDVQKAMSLGVLRDTASFAVRREVALIVTCVTAWSALAAAADTASGSCSGKDRLSCILDQLLAKRWKTSWLDALGSTSALPCVTMFLGAIAEALGLKLTAPGASKHTILAHIVNLFPLLAHTIRADMLARIDQTTERIQTTLSSSMIGDDSLEGTVEALERLRRIFHADLTLWQVLCEGDGNHEDEAPPLSSQVTSKLAHLAHIAIDVTLKILMDKRRDVCTPSNKTNEEGHDLPQEVDHNKQKLLCKTVLHVKSLATTYHSTLGGGGDRVSAAAAGGEGDVSTSSFVARAAAVLSDIFIAAAMEGGTGEPTLDMLKRRLIVSPIDSAALPTAKDVTAAFRALISKAITKAHTQLLYTYLQSSPVLFMRDFFVAVTAPLHQPDQFDFEPFLSIDDVDGKMFVLEMWRQQDKSTTSGATPHGGSPQSIADSVTGLDAYIRMFFGRQLGAYAAMEALLHSVVTAGGVHATTRIGLVLAAAGVAAMEFLVAQSGSPVALDHLNFMYVQSMLSSNSSAAAAGLQLFHRLAIELFPPATEAEQSVVSAASEEAALLPSPATTRAPSLSWLHSAVCNNGSTNLFAFFLPSLRALGVDHSVYTTIADAMPAIAPPEYLSEYATLSTHRRTLLTFLQLDQLSLVGASYVSPTVFPSLHAATFLRRLWTSEVTREQFTDMITEAGTLIAMRAAKIESVINNVAIADLDCSAALFYGTLRAIRHLRVMWTSETDVQLLNDVFDSIAAKLDAPRLPTSAQRDRKRIVQYHHSALGSVSPFDAQVLVSKSPLLPTPMESASVVVASSTCSTAVCDEPQSSVEPVATSSVEQPAEPPSVEPSFDSTTGEQYAESTSSPVVEEPTEASSSTEPPAVPPYIAPNVLSNVWIDWFWSQTFADTAPEASEARKVMLRSLAALNGVPTTLISKMRMAHRDEKPQLDNLAAHCLATHRKVLKAIFDPAVAAGKVPLLRPIVMQWTHELMLRATLSVPDAHASSVVFRQLLDIFASWHAVEETKSYVPLFVADVLRAISQTAHSHITHATGCSARGMAYFLQCFATTLLQWRQENASSLPSRHVPTFLAKGQDVELLKDLCMEMARTIEKLLSENTAHGDKIAEVAKQISSSWLGVYERSAQRVEVAQKERERTLRDSKDASAVISAMTACSWTYPAGIKRGVEHLAKLFVPELERKTQPPLKDDSNAPRPSKRSRSDSRDRARDKKPGKDTHFEGRDRRHRRY